tara:strand:+ start:842 stop:1156 length:315 start_codon:yes stop_codon:yes gene_type:complete
MLDNIGKTIADLDQKVNAFTKNEDLLIEKKSNIPVFNTKLIVYFVTPIILLVIFMFSKPSFIMKDEIVDNVVISSKFDFVKMTIIIIIISIPSNFFIHKKFIKE